MKIDVVNPSGTLRSINLFDRFVRRKVGKALEKVTLSLKKSVLNNMSLSDHTLKDMAKMGHPYGLQGGQRESWEAAKGVPARQKLHTPEYNIHTHTGNLKSEVYHKLQIQEKMGILGADRMDGIVGLNKDSKYAKYVIMGTRKMVSRDVLTETMKAERDSLQAMMKEVLK